MSGGKYKVRNPYKPLRFTHGVARTIEACADWRMVTQTCGAPGHEFWVERRSSGEFVRHDGRPPMQGGVVCNVAWRPALIETLAGRPLPVLGEAWEEAEAS